MPSRTSTSTSAGDWHATSASTTTATYGDQEWNDSQYTVTYPATTVSSTATAYKSTYRPLNAPWKTASTYAPLSYSPWKTDWIRPLPPPKPATPVSRPGRPRMSPQAIDEAMRELELAIEQYLPSTPAVVIDSVSEPSVSENTDAIPAKKNRTRNIIRE